MPREVTRRRRSPSSQARIILIVLLIFFGRGSAGAASDSSGPTDSKELEAFLDPIFASQMEGRHIPGAMIVLVKNGEVFFAKGYGLADLEKRTPVSPERTLFRVGSISKLFTATAVLQLAERGSLKLDEDVNHFLRAFKVEEAFGKPITFSHLLTHTAGLDERGIGMAARSEADLLPLGTYLARRLPPRVERPGEAINYSNHGFALLGYLVEVISGIPFEGYIRQNILQPLGMEHSAFRPATERVPDLAVGYEYRGDQYRPFPFDYLNVAPAGALLTTGTDMARFMIAHLQDGRFEERRILSDGAALEMHRRHFTNDPSLPGIAYGFFEEVKQGRRILWHNGGWFGFASRLLLLPDERTGLFISENSLAPGLYREVEKRFLQHYYPVTEKVEQPLVPFPAQNAVGRLAGHYRHDHYARRTLEKVGTLLDQARVIGHGDGAFTFSFPRDPEGPSQWRPIGPLLFERVGGEERIAFREDDQGRITHLLRGPDLFERIPWYETAAFHLGLIGGFITLFVWGSAVWLAGDLIRLPWMPPAPNRSRTRRLSGLTSFLNLVFLAGMAAALSRISPREFAYGLPSVVALLLTIPLITLAATAALWLFVAVAWTRGEGTRAGWLHDFFIALGALALIPFLAYWNLLGFHF